MTTTGCSLGPVTYSWTDSNSNVVSTVQNPFIGSTGTYVILYFFALVKCHDTFSSIHPYTVHTVHTCDFSAYATRNNSMVKSLDFAHTDFFTILKLPPLKTHATLGTASPSRVATAALRHSAALKYHAPLLSSVPMSTIAQAASTWLPLAVRWGLWRTRGLTRAATPSAQSRITPVSPLERT